MIVRWQQVRRLFMATALAVALGVAGMVAEPAATAIPTEPATARPVTAGPVTRTVKIKLVADQRIELHGDRFVGADPAVEELNRLVESAPVEHVRPLIDPAVPDSAVSAALDDYYAIRLESTRDVDALLAALLELPVVTDAYAQPVPPPPPVTPDLSGGQTYLRQAPEGIDRAAASRVRGGLGARVRVVDIEYSWNLEHEDLTGSRPVFVANGTPHDPFNSTNHGTAVAGELVAGDNGFGVTGIVNEAELYLVNALNLERGWDLAGALAVAASVTGPGDVILIEQQVYGPNGEFAPVEWLPEIYDAIRALTRSGRHVVEAAGNGGQNLDDRALFGRRFPNGKRDSGAIIVGAGEACGTPRRSQLSFSNYGKRVNLQGPGNCVVTTGYGDLFSGGDPNREYTQWFSGTSSASPVVAGAAAAVSSAHLEHQRRPLSPERLRLVLMITGTPQDKSVDRDHIGPLPNVAKALRILGMNARAPWSAAQRAAA